ncbi:MAG: energy transducer TonB [Acidobacteriaceae bacterium]
MPTTEVPTSPPGAPPEPPESPRRTGASRYQDYDTHDLLSVIEDLEGSRNWVSLREKFWIAIIIHLIVLWFLLYGPKYIFHQRVFVRDNSALLREHPKQMTYLETPDNIKPMTPKKPTPAISNKNHVAQSPHPVPENKTLQELEAMRPAGPPRPGPAPPAPKPAQPAPRAAQPKPPAQPLPTNAKSQIQAPALQAPKPNFSTGASTPGQQIQQMARNAARPGQYGGDMGAGAPSEHAGNQGAVDVLSDTLGVDFGPYIQRVIYDTKRAWYPIIPEVAQPPLNKQGRVGIRFRILPDGSVAPGSMHLDAPSGDVSLDKAAWAAINYAGYPPLPKNFKGPYLELRFIFLYNIKPGDQ